MGGDCLNVGCVPSKALLAAARAAASVRSADAMGVRAAGGFSVDFPFLMERMRRLRADISPHDSAERFRGLGVDVYFGQASFADPRTVEVDGQPLQFAKAVIATGGRAAAPPIPGLDAVDYLTNESVFSLTELPPTLGVVGGGPIGCELAQAFARFGAKVHLLERNDRVLPREDPEAAAVVQSALVRDGVRVHTSVRELRVEPAPDGAARLRTGDGAVDLTVSKLLISAGRRPNVEGLGLERAGIAFDDRAGVTVDDYLRTTNRRVFAAGDVCSRFQFTHAADFMARSVIRNALFLGRAKASSLTIPWCTYTSPELAHVGLTEKTADERGVAIDAFRQDFAEVDRAILDGETDGFVKVHVRRGGDKIVGATIVGRARRT